MSFLTSQQITDALTSSSPMIVGFHPDRVTTACYELGLGRETCITSPSTQRKIHDAAEQIIIPPGQFGLLITEETVHIPADILALISIKSSVKIRGLINVSGFHVDPGFQGKLKFSVYNAGSNPVVLEVGKPLFPIWFCRLAMPDKEPYDGVHKKQSSISVDDVQRMQGKVASPEALAADIETLRRRLSIVTVIGATCALSIIVPLFLFISTAAIKMKIFGDPPQTQASSLGVPQQPTQAIAAPTPATLPVSPVTPTTTVPPAVPASVPPAGTTPSSSAPSIPPVSNTNPHP